MSIGSTPSRFRRAWCLRLLSLAVASVCHVGGAAAADVTPPPPPRAAAAGPPPLFASGEAAWLPAWPGQTGGPTVRVGAYGGQITTGSLLSNLFEPWTIKLRDSYIVDVHAIYTAYRFEALPLDLEIEGGLAHRFGFDHQGEADLLPMARWKWLPWNGLVYTNVRLGLLGASYVDGVSATEVKRSGTTHGSRYLNFLVPEITFAPGPEADWEVFVRIHHRSGIYGLIDGVNGGSNYLSVGARFGVF